MKWCLVGKVAEGGARQTVPITSPRFTIGRREAVSLRVNCPTVSKEHAELIRRDDRLWVRDLGSTNGTYVNGEQVAAPIELHHGDLLQVAMVAFRVGWEDQLAATITESADACDKALLLIQLERMLSENHVSPKYQPIVDLKTGQTIAYEVLGRSRLFGMSSPKIMFEVASRLDLEPQLSHVMRMEGVRQSLSAGAPHLFVNTHPREMEAGNLEESLRALRAASRDQQITLEIHEAAMTNAELLSDIRRLLFDLRMALAYDDFGVGQARLQEIAAAPPDYLKFDMSMIRHLDHPSVGRQHMVRSLATMARSLGVLTVAEGVETLGEHLACQSMGFDLAQGFYYGKPGDLPR